MRTLRFCLAHLRWRVYAFSFLFYFFSLLTRSYRHFTLYLKSNSNRVCTRSQYERYGIEREKMANYMRSGSLQFIKQMELVANNMRIIFNDFFCSLSLSRVFLCSLSLVTCSLHITHKRDEEKKEPVNWCACRQHTIPFIMMTMMTTMNDNSYSIRCKSIQIRRIHTQMQ